jgi:hypothetical protein
MVIFGLLRGEWGRTGAAMTPRRGGRCGPYSEPLGLVAATKEKTLR